MNRNRKQNKIKNINKNTRMETNIKVDKSK